MTNKTVTWANKGRNDTTYIKKSQNWRLTFMKWTPGLVCSYSVCGLLGMSPINLKRDCCQNFARLSHVDISHYVVNMWLCCFCLLLFIIIILHHRYLIEGDTTSVTLINSWQSTNKTWCIKLLFIAMLCKNLVHL